MSIDATRWAYAQKTGSSARKAVLLSMADRAGEDHTCYPSLDRIASDTELNRKTVIKAIGELEQMGLIQFTGKTRGHGAKVYQLIGVPSRENYANVGDEMTANDAPSRPKNGASTSTNFGIGNTPTRPKNGTSTNFGTSTKNGTPTSTKNGTPTSTNFGTQTIIEPSLNHHNNIYMAKNKKNSIAKKSQNPSSVKKTDAPDFEFTDNQKTKCQNSGLDIHSQFEQFKNYHEAKGNRWANWSKAFDNWLINAVKWSKHPQTQTHHQGFHHAKQPHQPNFDTRTTAGYAAKLARDMASSGLISEPKRGAGGGDW